MMHSVLFIAPFEELTKTAKRVMHNRNLDIEIVTASNEKAVQIAKSRPDKTILISRGGTANDLKRLPERTVVEITTTFSDILEEIQDAVFAGYTQIGIVTNNNIIDKRFCVPEYKNMAPSLQDVYRNPPYGGEGMWRRGGLYHRLSSGSEKSAGTAC